MAELGQIEIAKIDATKIEVANKQQVYPMVEEMILRAIIKSEEHGYRLLRAIQILVNELGADVIISAVDEVEKNPALLTKAKTYLPYLKMIP